MAGHPGPGTTKKIQAPQRIRAAELGCLKFESGKMQG
jgi:hypothetical protein